MKARYLTKSLFKLAMECPTKLYYQNKPAYANRKMEDAFLLALADGGFQVGELAKHYFLGGDEVSALDHEEALGETNRLLQRENVVIYEAAVRSGDLFVRVDILVKEGSWIRLIEVKAKSTDQADESAFLGKNGSITSGWKPYLYDVAFQKYVLTTAFPDFKVSAYLMLANTRALCPTEGLNQKFKISRDESGRKRVTVTRALTPEDLENPILCQINVDGCCEIVYGERFGANGTYRFEEFATYLAEHYKKDLRIAPVADPVCSKCEFNTSETDPNPLKSGFRECWSECFHWSDADFEESTIFEIWNFRGKKALMESGRLKMSEVWMSDISPEPDAEPGLSLSQRQWLQIEKTRDQDPTPWIDRQNLRREMDSWVYPLHFIDFETTSVPIPFNKGRHPYEGVAFQYSHHLVHADGRIEHKGQYLNTTPGYFPNYDFLRHLKEELDHDRGSIFRYAAHENTYLNLIYRQLREDPDEIQDREELCFFIQSITQSGRKSDEQWVGERNMIDMLKLVKRYYYHPAMKGSNSIKQVLPAILNSSEYLQHKYQQPVYGAKDGIPSLNYSNWRWIEFEDRKVIDPYRLLPKLFQDVADKDLELLMSEGEDLKDGGAAMTAYARMQFEEMSEFERTEIQNALLKYCELDTLAMVMIYEGWTDLLRETE